MALDFYDEGKVLIPKDVDLVPVSPLRTSHDGRLGGVHERLLYLRNDDVANYYTDLTVLYEAPTYQDIGEFGDTGWGVKYMYGERQPTEAEWDLVRSGEAIMIPDIGTTLAADTYTYHPIWVRIYCPGGVAAQLRESQRIRVNFFEQKVGA